MVAILGLAISTKFRRAVLEVLRQLVQRCALAKKLKHLPNFLRTCAGFVTRFLNAMQRRTWYPYLTIWCLFHCRLLLHKETLN
ncbi:protein of unknown function [Pseudorhizobium banfieldiae]|uniref:Uncharacterized protein n=1 Tax=Pseudorhizobium banfieldiae TaxID=1125847 RepID=L0NLA0_9HYPH|nr:protein of unknown function [Pseudorhizobium banfieldiae]